MAKKRLICTYHFLVKSLSVVSALAAIAAVWIMDGAFPDPAVFLLALLGASAIMLVLPIREEEAAHSAIAAAAIAVLFLGGIFLRAEHTLILAVLMLAMFLYFAYRSTERYSRIRPLFRQFSILYSIGNHARLMYALGWGVLAAFTVAAADTAWLCILLLLPALSLYLLLIVRYLSGRTMFLSPRKEKSIVYLAQGKLKTVHSGCVPADDLESSEKMRELYSKILNVMDEVQPFLDEDYSLQDLASAVYTNKTYLSKTINVLSGRNFRQFINYYRIKYSVEQLHKNPRLRVDELASMSGFHSTVTYNMAFKVNMSETPGEYSQKLRARLN